MIEQMQEEPQQDPPYRKKLYGILSSNFSDFKRTEEEFYSKLDNEPAYAEKVHGLLSEKFSDFKRPKDEFLSLVKKKENVVASEDSSPDGVPSEQASPNGLVATPPSLSPLQSAQQNNTQQANVDIFAVRGDVKGLTDQLAAEVKLNQSASAGPGGYIPVAANTSTTAKELEVAKTAQENKFKNLSSKFGVSVDEIKKITDQLNTPISEDLLSDLVKLNPYDRAQQTATYNWIIPFQKFAKESNPAQYRNIQNQLLAIQGYQTDPTTGEVKIDEKGNKIKSNPDYKANRSLTSAGKNFVIGMGRPKAEQDVLLSNYQIDKKGNYNFRIKGAIEAVLADPRHTKNGGYLSDNQVLALQYYEDTNPDLAATYEKLNTPYAKKAAPTTLMPDGFNESENEKGEAYVRMERDLEVTGAMLNSESTQKEMYPYLTKLADSAATTEEQKIYDTSIATIDKLRGSIGKITDLLKSQKLTDDDQLTVNAYSSQLERASETIGALKTPTTREDVIAYNIAATDYNHAASKIKEILDTKPSIPAKTKENLASNINAYNAAVSTLSSVQESIKNRSMPESDKVKFKALAELNKQNEDALAGISTNPRFALAFQGENRAIAKKLADAGDGIVASTFRVINEKAGHLRDFVNGVGNAVFVAPFRSDKYNNATQMAVLEGQHDEEYHNIQNNKNLTIQRTEYYFANKAFEKDVNAINSSTSDKAEAQEKIVQLMEKYDKAGGTGFTEVSIDPKFNFGAKSMMISIGKTAADLGVFMAELFITGGMSAEAGAASRMMSMGSTVFIDSLAPEYARLLASGNKNPTANALLNTAINSAAMILAEPAQILSVSPSMIRRLLGQETAIGKMVSKLTDSELRARLTQTGFGKMAEFIKTNGLHSIGGAARMTGATTLGQMTIQQIAGEKIDYDATMKEASVSLISQIPVFFSLGAMHSASTPFHKSALYEAASRPDFYISEVGKMVKEGKLTQEKADEIVKNTLFSSKVLSKIENVDNNGNTLNDSKKADLLFQKTKEAGLLEYLKKDIPDAVRAKVENEVKEVKKVIQKIFSAPAPQTIEIAALYKKDKGIDTPSGSNITKLDIDNSKNIADEYDAMKHDPNNPEVKASYDAMAQETLDQFTHISKSGIKFELYDGPKREPYASSEEMITDVRDNNHLFVLSTEKDFGETPITDVQRSENPLLKDSGATDVNGKKLLYNDLFRGVHDLFGHTERGNSFGAVGEENAWDVHSRMYTPLARRAMTTETRGQNSWVNFGKQMRNADGSIKKKGDEGYMSPNERPFADQKVGLLPDKFSIIESKAKESDFEISNDPTGFEDGVKAQQATLGADGIQVTPYEQAEYDNEAKNGAKFWRSKDGTSFGILKASGEMASVVKGAASKLKGVAGAMLESMKKQGGKFLDNFDTHLTGIYQKAGFEVAARLPFNEEFAPAGWDAEGSPLKNKPDIVMMVRRDLMPKTGEVKFTDYNQAQKYIKEIVAVKKISTSKEAVATFTPEEKKVWKQHMVEGNKEAADAMVQSKMDIEKKVYTAENIDSVDTEGYDGVQKEVIGDVKAVFKAVSKLVNESTGKPLSIHIHANDKSFAEAEGVGEQNSGSKGVYMSSDGSIHLNMARVTPETMLHEAFHPVLDIIQKNNPALIDKLHAQLKTIKGGDKIIDANDRKYNGDVTKKKEAITDFIAQVADGTFKLNQSNFEQAKNYIINALRKVGLGGVLDKFGAIKNAEDLRALAKMISEKFTKGEEISTKDLDQVKIKEGSSVPQFSKGDELAVEEKDYKSAKEILKENKEKFKKNPEAVTPEPQLDKNGKIKLNVVEGNDGKREIEILYKSVPYNLENGSLKYISKNREKAINILSDRLVSDYNENKDRPEISAAIGWYGNMRKWFQTNFGANIEVFGQLLAATSARTEVVDNFKQAVEAIRNLAKGKYDDLLKDYDNHIKNIKSLSEEELKSKWQEKNPKKRLSEFNADDYKRFLINQYEGLPLRSNGKKFNANSKKVLQALYGNWIEQTEGPKTKNFAGNLTGRSFDATIDVWAARYLRRSIFDNKVKEWRILPQSETGVQFGKTKSGKMTGDYPFAEEVMKKAADKIGINADDLQAFLWYLEKDVWDKNKWTNTTGKKKASFEDTASSISSDRYQLGVTTFKGEGSFDPIEFEKEREIIEKEIGNIPGVMASRVNKSEGEFVSATDVFIEPTFDIEFTVEKDSDISNVIKKVHEIQDKYNQDASIISKFVDETHPNARPIIEVGLSTPVEKSIVINEIKKTLSDLDVRGFTIAKDKQGKILGLRAQFIPEFEKNVSIDDGIQRFVKAFEAIKEKHGNDKEISYFSSDYVDSQIKFKENETKSEQNGGALTSEQGIQGELPKQETRSTEGVSDISEKQRKQNGRQGDRAVDGVAGEPEIKPQFSKANRLEREENIKKSLEDGLIDKSEYDEMMAEVKLNTATSTKNATVAAEREARGLDMINKDNPETFEKWKTQGIDAIGKTFFPDLEAISIIKNPRSLSAVENASMLFHRTKLNNQREDLIDLINSLDGDKKNIDINTIKLLEVEELINRNDEAVTRSGTETGRALAARKMMMADDYTLANMERRLKAISGGKILDKDTMDKLRDYEAQIKDLQGRLAKYEKGDNIEAIKNEVKKVTIKKVSEPAFKAKVLSIIERMMARKKSRNDAQFSRTEKIELDKDDLSDIKSLFKSYVEQGLTDHVEIIDNIHNDLADVLDISKDQLRDEISGYGKTSELSKEDIDVAMRDIKAQMKLFSSMEDVQNNERPLKSGLQREDPSDTVRQMRQQLNDMMKKADFKDEKSEKEYKSALDAIKKRLTNQIADLENMIQTGERRQPSDKVEYDVEANRLLTERDNLKDTLNQLDEASGLTAERKSKAVENALKRAIENLERRINNNELENKKADATPDSEATVALRARKDSLKDELNQLRKDAGIIDANKLEAYKKSLKKRADEYQRRIDNNEFETKTPAARKIDKETLGLLSAIEDVKIKFDVAKLEYERKNMSKIQLRTKKLLKFRRAILLSSFTTLGKIGAAGSGLMITKPLEELAGSGIRLIPGFRRISAGAAREGAGFTYKAEAKAITELFKNRIKLESGEEVSSTLNDWRRIMQGKKGSLESVYGKKTPHLEESEFFGNTHAAIKYMPKMNEVYRSMELRFEHALKNGEDISDPVVYARVVSEAIVDGNRHIFMGKNLVTDAYKSVKRTLEAKGMIGKAGANTMDFLFPIVSVPTNFVLATGEHLVGTVAAPAMIVMKGGVKNLTAAEKDTVMRLMKKGSVGLAFLALGILNPQSIGGYYSGKREEGDLEENTMKFFGVTIGKWAMHTPLLEVMQFGATIRRLIDKQDEEGEISSWSSAAGMAAAHLTEEVPFVNTTSDLLDAMDDEKKATKFAANTVSSLLVPPDVKKLTKGEGAFAPVAKAFGYKGDVDSAGEVNKRRAISFIEQIESNIPGLKETLPMDAKVLRESAKEEVVKQIRNGKDYRDVDQQLFEKSEITKSGIIQAMREQGMDSKTIEFKNGSAEKQLKLWTTFGDAKKLEAKSYLNNIEEFNRLTKEKPELLKEPKYNRAFNNIKAIFEK